MRIGACIVFGLTTIWIFFKVRTTCLQRFYLSYGNNMKRGLVGITYLYRWDFALNVSEIYVNLDKIEYRCFIKVHAKEEKSSRNFSTTAKRLQWMRCFYRSCRLGCFRLVEIRWGPRSGWAIEEAAAETLSQVEHIITENPQSISSSWLQCGRCPPNVFWLSYQTFHMNKLSLGADNVDTAKHALTNRSELLQ